MSDAKFQSHVEDLCREHGIRLTHEQHATGSSFASKYEKGGPVIGVKPVADEITYVEAMHEIGHILGDDAFGPEDESDAQTLLDCGLIVRSDITRALVREDAAWAWAQEHALAWTPAMSAKRDAALASYRQGYGIIGTEIVNPLAAMVVITSAPDGHALLRLAELRLGQWSPAMLQAARRLRDDPRLREKREAMHKEIGL